MDDVDVDGACSPASATDEMVLEYSSYANELLSLDTSDHDARCTSTSISDPVSIAAFRSECSRYLEMAKSEDGVARRVAQIPPGPVRDFGLTEMLGISIAELKTVREECR